MFLGLKYFESRNSFIDILDIICRYYIFVNAKILVRVCDNYATVVKR